MTLPLEIASAPAMSDLTVVIVSWNTRDLLRDCLRSLYSGGLEGVTNAAVHVVDNASNDGSAAMVLAEFPQVAVTANTENVGFARANNQALEHAMGRYLLLLNSDTVVPRGAIADLIDAMDAHPDAAVCSPLLLNADGSPQFCWARFPNLASELRGALALDQSPYPLDDYADPKRRALMNPFVADWVGGACYLVRAALVPQVGLLDPAFFMYSEETDWCRRFRAIGASTLLVPAVTVTHLGGQSSCRVPSATRERMYRSRARFFRLHYGPLGALPPTLIAWARYYLFRWKHRGQETVGGGSAGAVAG
jgi:GT2 family glycosyltransferase